MARLASRATLAGILGLVSLVVPLQLLLYQGASEIDWTVFGVSFYNGASNVFNVTQFDQWDAAFNVLLLLAVLVGGILLLALRGKPKIGGILLAIGAASYVLDAIYDQYTYGPFTPIPLGFFLILAAAIVGLAARPALPYTPLEAMRVESSADRLLKLKGLLDSGAITKEEYEEQKKKTLEAG